METEQIRSLEEQRDNLDWVSTWMLDRLGEDKNNRFDGLVELEALVTLNCTKNLVEKLIQDIRH